MISLRIPVLLIALTLAGAAARAADLDDPDVAALPPPPRAGQPPLVCYDTNYCWHPYEFRTDSQTYNDPRPVPSTYDFWQPPPPVPLYAPY